MLLFLNELAEKRIKSSLKNVLAESQGIAVPWRQQGLIAAQLLTVGRKASKLSSIINQLFKMLPLTWHATDGLRQGLIIQHRLGWTYNPLALLSHRLGLQVWTIVFSCERFIGRKNKTKQNRKPESSADFPQRDRIFAGQVSDNMEGRILYFKRRSPPKEPYGA